jgi:hypothetical protein
VGRVKEVSMTRSDPEDFDRDANAVWPTGDALDRALAAGLRAPALPEAFRATLRQAITREAEKALRERRGALEAEHARRLAEMRAGYVTLRRDTFVLALSAAAGVGLLAALALPWLAATAGVDASVLEPLAAAIVGASVGTAVWLERTGLPRWL